jgi:hypothetical protein
VSCLLRGLVVLFRSEVSILVAGLSTRCFTRSYLP